MTDLFENHIYNKNVRQAPQLVPVILGGDFIQTSFSCNKK